jgi:hypothetical protein
VPASCAEYFLKSSMFHGGAAAHVFASEVLLPKCAAATTIVHVPTQASHPIDSIDYALLTKTEHLFYYDSQAVPFRSRRAETWAGTQPSFPPNIFPSFPASLMVLRRERSPRTVVRPGRNRPTGSLPQVQSTPLLRDQSRCKRLSHTPTEAAMVDGRSRHAPSFPFQRVMGYLTSSSTNSTRTLSHFLLPRRLIAHEATANPILKPTRQVVESFPRHLVSAVSPTHDRQFVC